MEFSFGREYHEVAARSQVVDGDRFSKTALYRKQTSNNGDFVKCKAILVTSFVVAMTVIAMPGQAATSTINGKITVSKKLKLPKDGVLFIFAKSFGVKERRPPIAVKRIPSPKFPLSFSLTGADVMRPGAKFEGKVKLTARFSPSGAVFPRQGSFEGSTGDKNAITIGQKNMTEIVIDTQL